MSNDKVLELAKKLKALADRGIGGERDNAKEQLEKLMNKYGITPEDLEQEEQKDYFFKVPDNEKWYARKILLQVCGTTCRDIKIYGEFTKKMIKEHFLPGNYMVTCTPLEYVEILAKWDFYKKAFLKELPVFFRAFFTANQLLAEPTESEKNEEMTEEEYKEHLRANRMAEGINKQHYKKQISQ